jgi:hypothetical protein
VDRKVRLELRHTKIPIKILDLEDQAMSTPRGVVNGLSPTRESAGVMEKWSSGVMQRLSNVESWGWLCPTLQYSNTAKSLVIFTGKPIETRPGPEK